MGEAKAQAKIEELEESLRLLREAHSDEKTELETTIGRMKQETTRQEGVGDRLSKLEDIIRQMSAGGAPAHQPRQVPVVTAEASMKGREEALDMTFGDLGDTSPANLERFISHYDLVDEINKAREVRVWEKPAYRALMLRKAFKGTAWDYVRQEAKMGNEWTSNDREIIDRLRKRYVLRMQQWSCIS